MSQVATTTGHSLEINEGNESGFVPTIRLSLQEILTVVAVSLEDAKPSALDSETISTGTTRTTSGEDDADEPSLFCKDKSWQSREFSIQVPASAIHPIQSTKDSNDADSTIPPLVRALPSTETAVNARKRATLLSATVIKQSLNDKLGLGLLRRDGALRISSIFPGGLLSESTPFHVGDRLISINQVNCQNMSKSQAANLLRSIAGTLTIVVHDEHGDSQLVESMICKPHPDSKLGLGIISSGYSRARLSSISPDGMFVDSLLSRKDLILSINDVSCQYLDSKEVADILVRAKDQVTIIAERKHESAIVIG